MNSKFLKILLAVLFSSCVLSQARAALISADPTDPYYVVGNNYSDLAGVKWQYLGYFDLADGPAFNTNPDAYTGLEAALELFGLIGDVKGSFALSAFEIDSSQPGVMTHQDIDDEKLRLGSSPLSFADVNHMAWYDTWEDSLEVKGEATPTNQDTYSAGTPPATSAFVNDRAVKNENLTYVFKAISVSEPTSLAIFALALVGVAIRRSKQA